MERLINDIKYTLLDLLDYVAGRREPLIPPRRLMFDGPKDPAIFKANGQEFLKYYIELCHLKPSEKILDVGSGIGRKTIPLIDYLNEQGRYEGFDINKVGVQWCREKISANHPNFHFQWADVYNQRYNPEGTYPAAEYKFPFDDESFDFVVLGSVFTHFVPPDLENYLREVARVLKSGVGRCLISYFLRNEESAALVEAGKSVLDIKHDMGGYWTSNPALPEDAIAHDEATILRLYDSVGLSITPSIHYGSWCGRSNYLSFQDLIVAYKK
ncbi:MAG: class I SAM-dependent methyltransferase [Chloroflexi bacterium]|nr:MAG: class I SAM-dependent methyltransferase [Chloroflexota bacterium]